MRTRCVTLLATLGLLVAAAPAAAQVFCIPVDDSGQEPDLDDVAACAAATTTPFGALPTNLPASWLGRTSTGIGFNFGFGSMSEEGDAGRRNFGIGIDIPVGRASLGFTGGLADFTCDVPEADVECKNAIMLGARFATPLISTPVSGGGTGQSFIVGLNTSLGFSTGDILSFSDPGDSFEIGGRGITVGIGVPLGLVARSGTITITPFVEPAFFWGQTKFDVNSTFGNEEETESGTGFSFGGGVSFGFANGLALDIGFKKVMIDEANALIGVGLSFQR
jgi:opacity protein-like surface antigen